MAGWRSLSLDEIDPITVADGLRWHPVRRTLGVEAFGVNAYTASDVGQPIVEEHTERTLRHEELYVVLTGRVRFTLDGEEVDAPAGTLLFVSDPAVRRAGHATETPATVLALGGPRDAPYAPSAWEWYFAAEQFRPTMDTDGALALLSEAAERFPDHAGVTYATACWLALAGRDDDALAAARRAIELDPGIRDWAARDEDLASIRDRLPPPPGPVPAAD